MVAVVDAIPAGQFEDAEAFSSLVGRLCDPSGERIYLISTLQVCVMLFASSPGAFAVGRSFFAFSCDSLFFCICCRAKITKYTSSCPKYVGVYQEKPKINSFSSPVAFNFWTRDQEGGKRLFAPAPPSRPGLTLMQGKIRKNGSQKCTIVPWVNVGGVQPAALAGWVGMSVLGNCLRNGSRSEKGEHQR